jgi:outer membrane immunogenic protein
MRKTLLVLIVAAIDLSANQRAPAADIVRRPVYVPPLPVPYVWTGCYIGGNVGWGLGRETVSIPDLGDVSLPSVTGDIKGVLGGGQVGCNYQFAPNWVIGIEGDGEAANMKGDVTHSVSFRNPLTGLPATVSGTVPAQTDWIASVTGRLGWTWDRVMLYAKGGAAWAGYTYSLDLPAFNEHIETSATRPGWTVGGGVEWAFWDNWSAKVEYDFYGFGTSNLSLPGTIAGVPDVVRGVNVKQTDQTVKFGINYRFGAY